MLKMLLIAQSGVTAVRVRHSALLRNIQTRSLSTFQNLTD